MGTRQSNLKALLIINVGTPDEPEKKAVKRYLREFLNDPLVIDLPFLLRFFLVNGIIIPFRVKKSTGLYKQVWTSNGSPLLYHMQKLTEKLSKKLVGNCDVFMAMRYGKPGLPEVLDKIKQGNYKNLQIIPLFPHYASATTGTAIAKAEKTINNWPNKPQIQIIKQFYSHPSFIRAYTSNIASEPYKEMDHIIFSYHGLPLRQINKVHPNVNESRCNCTTALPDHGHMCYKATCFETTRLFIKSLALDPGKCTTSFQSRLTKKWLEPTTEQVIHNLNKQNIKKIMVVAPSFTTDCLETNVEIGIEYRELFLSGGGESFHWVQSLNSSNIWVDAMMEIIA